VDVALINKKPSRCPSIVNEGVEDVLVLNSPTISPFEVFSKFEQGPLVILEGRPGSGKTTLT